MRSDSHLLVSKKLATIKNKVVGGADRKAALSQPLFS